MHTVCTRPFLLPSKGLGTRLDTPDDFCLLDDRLNGRFLSGKEILDEITAVQVVTVKLKSDYSLNLCQLHFADIAKIAQETTA